MKFYKAVKIVNSDKSINAYIPIVMSIKNEKTEKFLNINSLIPYMIKNINKIDIPINKAFTKAGLFGGITVDFYSMGYKAGEKVNLLLKGIDIKKIKIEDASDSVIIINLTRLKKLNMKLDDKILNIVDEFYK